MKTLLLCGYWRLMNESGEEDLFAGGRAFLNAQVPNYVYPTATSCARSRVTKDDMTQYGRNIAITIMVKDNQLAEMVS